MLFHPPSLDALFLQGVSGLASHVPLTGTSLALSILIITAQCSPSVAASQHIKLIIGLLVKKGLAPHTLGFPTRNPFALEKEPRGF